MRIDIHSHTAPAKYVEAIRRDPKSMGCRIEKDDQGRESIVQESGRSTRLRPSLIDPERRLRQVAAEQIDVIVESLLPPLLPLWAPTLMTLSPKTLCDFRDAWWGWVSCRCRTWAKRSGNWIAL